MSKAIRYDLLSIHCGELASSGQVIPTGEIRQFVGVQSSEVGFNFPTENVKGLGALNTVQNPNSSPTVSVSFSTLFGDCKNEGIAGIITDGRAGAFVSVNSGEKNLYLSVDKFSGTTGDMVLSIGNAALTQYGISARVGDFVSSSFSFEGFNSNLQYGRSGNAAPNVFINTGKEVPATYSLPDFTDGNVNKAPGLFGSKLFTKPGEIILRIKSGEYFGMPIDLPLNGFDLSMNLSRVPDNRIGEKYPYKRHIECPIEVSLSIDVVATGLISGKQLKSSNFDFNNFEIVTKECCDSIGRDWREACNDKVKIMVNGAKLTNQSFSNGVGQNGSMKIEYTLLISNPVSFEKNIIISGAWGRFDEYLHKCELQKSGSFLTPESYFSNTSGTIVEAYRTSYETSIPNFSMTFSGNLPIYSGQIPPSYFSGIFTGVSFKSGVMNSGLIGVSSEIQKISSSLPSPYLSLEQSKSDYFYGFTLPATTGFFTTGNLPGLFPEEQAVTETKFLKPIDFDVMVKSENFYSGPVDVKYYSKYPITISFQSGFFVTPQKPFYINKMTASFPNNNQNDVGANFDVYFVLNNSGNITKTYRTNWTVI